MKTYMCLIISAMVSGGSLLNAAELGKPAGDLAATPVSADLVATLLCARTIIENGLDGYDGVNTAAQYLISAKSNTQNEDALAALANHCSAGLEEMKAASEFMIDRKQQINSIDALQISPGIKEMLKGFARAEVSCTGFSLNVGAEVIIGLTAKVGYSKCLGSNGRQWLQTSAGLGSPVGIGIGATVQGGTRVRAQNYHKSPLTLSQSETAYGGVVIATSTEGPNSTGLIPTVAGNHEEFGIGLGLGASVGMLGQVDVEIVPLGTDEAYLQNRFLSLNP